MRINRATKLFIGFSILLLAWISWGMFTPVQASCRIENISLERGGKFTKVTLYADEPFEFVHATEEAKDGKPYRVIIDCKDALFGLPQNNFTEGLPAGSIKGIRTSQFQVVPEKIVRVVLDVQGPVVYKILEVDDKKKASIALLTAQDPDFPLWMASTDGRRIESEPTVDKRKTTTSKIKTSRYSTALGPSQEETKVEEKIQESQVEKTKETEQLVTEPASSEETEEKSSISSSTSEQTLVHRSARRRRISRSPTPLGPYPQELAVTGETTADQTQNVKPEDITSQAKGAVAEGIAKILGPESVVAKETQSIPESLMIAHQTPQVELELIPHRKVVHYESGAKRDPFMPLIGRKDMSFGIAPLPLFENLKLVGILRDGGGNRALLEDEVGFGYILMSGDRIRDGYVMSVGEDNATFHIEEYGGYQIRVLEINQEY